MGATALLALALAHASFVQACAIDACTCSFKFAAVHTSISDTQERPELVLNGCYDSRDLAMCPYQLIFNGKVLGLTRESPELQVLWQYIQY